MMTDDVRSDAASLIGRAGDVEFATFFAEHHAPMVRALALAVGDPELGRDAAAEGFTRALDRWRTVRDHTNPAGWVYRVGLNWARSRLRRTSRERRSETSGVGAITEPFGDDVVTDPSMIAALRELSADHRAVIVGRYFLDWSEAELAAALRVAPGTVKSRLSRGLHHLATLMEAPDAR